MTRKILITLFLLLFCSPSAQAGPKNVLAVQSVSIAPYEEAVRGFEQASGAQVRRISLSDPEERELFRTLRGNETDMILAVGRDALSLAAGIKNLPVVYAMVLNPQAGVAGRRNIGGVSMSLPPEKQLSALAGLLPAAKNIGLIYDPRRTGPFVRQLRDLAPALGINIMAQAVSNSRDVPSTLARFKGRIDLFWMLPDITVLTPETEEALFLYAIENKIPLLTFSDKYLEMGAMLSIGIDPFDMGVQAGEMARRLFSGEGEMQHLEARRALITINLPVAEKLRVRVDDRALKNIRVIR